MSGDDCASYLINPKYLKTFVAILSHAELALLLMILAYWAEHKSTAVPRDWLMEECRECTALGEEWGGWTRRLSKLVMHGILRETPDGYVGVDADRFFSAAVPNKEEV